jgi:hypothetical protein
VAFMERIYIINGQRVLPVEIWKHLDSYAGCRVMELEIGESTTFVNGTTVEVRCG